MAVVSLAAGAVILAAMIAIAAYGAVTLPPDARVPIHHGIGSYNNFVPKTAGLIVWPAGEALIYAILVGVSQGALKPNHAGRPAALVIMPIVLALVCAFEWGAISAARRNTAARSG
jgi:hypothetical protein